MNSLISKYNFKKERECVNGIALHGWALPLSEDMGY